MTLLLLPGPYALGAESNAAVTIENDPTGGLVLVDADAPGVVEDGKTWSTAYRSLAAALANVFSADIWVAQGTYTPGATTADTFALGSDVALYGGFAGAETNVNQRNWAARETVLSGSLGGGVFAQHVLTKGTGGLTVLDGFTIRDGAGGAADGGGMLPGERRAERGQLPLPR